LNIEISCGEILLEINGNFKEAYLIRHREINITCTKGYIGLDFVILVKKYIIFLRVEHPVL